MNKTIIEKLNWRYAVKKFDASKKINASDWDTIEESLRLSPSSFGLQPWKFIVITNQDLKKKLTPVSWGQPQVETCDRFVILAHKKSITVNDVNHYVDTLAKERNLTKESLEEFKGMVMSTTSNDIPDSEKSNWNAKQAYIAMGVSLTTAALLAVDACPMEGLDKAKYDEILGLPADYTTAAAIAFGYRAADDGYQGLKKVRYATKDIIEHR